MNSHSVVSDKPSEMDLTEEQQKLINRIALENGLSDFQLVKTPGSIKGDNFLGILTAITLTDREKTLELILKSAHTNEAFRKAAPIHGMYDREIYMYRKVFEEFKKFQEEYNISDPFDSVAKMYGYCIDDTEECFVMENLKKSGYQLWNKTIPMNDGHVRAVLIEYAKFHAISFAMKRKNPELFAELTEPLRKNVFENMDMLENKDKLRGYVKAVMDNGNKAVADDPELIECLKKVETKVIDLFENGFNNEDFKLVVSHGDCWCNNFLFKYKDSNNNKSPISLRILDWQITSLTSPAVDISYFFLTNSSQEVFDNYLTYFHLYYDTLRSQLNDFGCDVDDIFPYSEFQKHLDQYIVFGLHMSITILKVVECLPEEVPDFAENGSFEGGLDFDLTNMESYKKRLSSLLRFIHKNKFV